MTQKIKILLIDDEELVREELGGLLEDEGYEVITGADGEEGISLFRSAGPDMVITDVRMPRRDGLSVAITIRQEDPTVPVTVITGHGNEAMAIQALRAGVTDFIKKPVRLDDLTSALSRMEAARRPAKPPDEALPESVELQEYSHTYVLENDLSVVPLFVEHLLQRCAADLDRVRVLELSLALRELVINAIEHGNLGVTFEEKGEAMESGDMGPLIAERSGLHKYMSRRVTVLARRLERRVVIQVADEGEGFDWHALPDPTDAPNLLSSHGRGILLARMSVDNMSFNEAGNEVTIEKLF
jgi:FixJ family two-component response regulator/anti-sigma regulatory factor (Ser/Thr protein kinase)